MSRKGECYDNAVAESFFNTLKRLDDIQRLVIIHPMIMNKRFIRRITQLNKSLLGLSWVGFANLGASPQTPLFNQKEQGYNLLKWCPVKWGNRNLSPLFCHYLLFVNG